MSERPPWVSVPVVSAFARFSRKRADTDPCGARGELEIDDVVFAYVLRSMNAAAAVGNNVAIVNSMPVEALQRTLESFALDC